MKILHVCILYPTIFILNSCSPESNDATYTYSQVIEELSEVRTASEADNDLNTFLSLFQENAICMPEYQLTLTGAREIEAFYKEIFARQHVHRIRREISEIIPLGTTMVEIGTFKREYTESGKDSLITQQGKYWNVWSVDGDDHYNLTSEAYGYFHPVRNPEQLIVAMNNPQPDEADIQKQKEVPFELKAYNALMEKGVRQRDGILRTEFFTEDGQFMPFADSTVAGLDKIRPYLIAYNSGDVTIDSVACYTYDFEDFEGYILEYDMFKVKWRIPNYSGQTEGKGIRLWKRQDDKSLKLFREISTHNHI